MGTTEEIVKKLIAGNKPAERAWLAAKRGEHGGAHNPHGLGGKSGKTAADIVEYDNVKLDKEPAAPGQAPTGNSSDQGLRRLDKAAQRGDAKADELLRQVLAHKMTVHAACLAMGWRKATKSVVDTPTGHAVAAIKCSGALGTVQQVYLLASPSDRQQIYAWVTKQHRAEAQELLVSDARDSALNPAS